MSDSNPLNMKRILIVDDNVAIHDDFRRILTKKEKEKTDYIQEILFGDKDLRQSVAHITHFNLDYATQGEEALQLVKTAIKDKRPYSLAFVDIRMPPGWNGIQTIKQLWKIDPDLQVVICTAFSDYSWLEMFSELNGSGNFLILKKPFEAIEIRQLALALTQKWEYKRRIEQTVENLEATVSERTYDLKHALELAEDANQLKNEFLKNVSLELIDPLNSIIGFTELIYHGKADVDHIQEYYGDIISSAKFLLQMITDIVDMSMLEAKTIHYRPERVNINELIDEVQDSINPLIKKNKLHFSKNVEANLSHIVIDPIKLKQILHHYLSNAIKFTPQGGKIEVNVSNYNSDQFKIEIIDTGIGIHEEDLKKLFIPFQQLDLSSSKKYKGIGLGLALTRRIVEFQMGKVGVESTVGKGSRFYAILPCKPMI